MAYRIRTLDELATQAWGFITSKVQGAVINLWPNTFRVLGKVLAALGFEHQIRWQWLWKQVFVSTADDWNWLIRHGFEYGIIPLPARRAVGSASVSAIGGMLIPAGVQFQRADGAIFRTRTSDFAPGTLIELSLEAADVGRTGNTGDGAALMLVVGTGEPAGLGSTATVGAGGIGGGAEQETKEAFRGRILDRKRQPPQGGSKTDYVRWVKEANGDIRRVWPRGFSNDDRRTWVTFTINGRMNFIPLQSDVDAVAAYLNDDVRRPITARIDVFPPTPVDVPVVIQGLSPDTVATREAINAELQALFFERMEPALPGEPFMLPRAWVDEAISRAAGEFRHTLVSPSGNVTFGSPGQFPVFSGAASFV